LIIYKDYASQDLKLYATEENIAVCFEATSLAA
jgi:hypothetical protein